MDFAKFFLPCFCIFSFHTSLVNAAPGDPDTTFDTDGLASGSHPSGYYAASVQSDGKIVAIGADVTSTISRYNTDGSLDTSFDSDGINTGYFGASGQYARDIVIQQDGKIIVLGRVNDDIAVARFNSDGSVDSSFGLGSGRVFYDVQNIIAGSGSSAELPNAIALQADGKILITGTSTDVAKDQLFVMRLNTDGSLDTSFRTSGVKIYTFGQQSIQYGYDIALKPDGKIVVAGKSWVGGVSDKEDILIVVLNSDGTLDFSFTAFGSGWAIENVKNYERLTSVVVQPDGKIIAAGWAGNGSSTTDFLIVRYNTDGSLDTSFDTDGIALIDGGASFDRAWAIALQPDGKILFSGWASNNVTMRLNANGSVDNTFSSSLPGFFAFDMELMADGKVILAGNYTGDSGLYRLENNSLDTMPVNFAFTDESDVSTSSLITSNMVTITGLSAGISVPVSIENGEYAINGSTTYQSGIGFVSVNDQINVRHTSSASNATTVDTVLKVGGILPTNSQLALIPNSDTFTSTTSGAVVATTTPTTTTPTTTGTATTGTSTAGGGSGGGSLTFHSLFLLLLITVIGRMNQFSGIKPQC